MWWWCPVWLGTMVCLVIIVLSLGVLRKGTCPFCRGLVPKEAVVCQHCGRDLPASPPPASPPPASPPRPRAGVNCWYCPFCGGTVPKHAPVCQHCGKHLATGEH